MNTMTMTTISRIFVAALSGLNQVSKKGDRVSSTKSSQASLVRRPLSNSHVATRTKPTNSPMAR